MIASLATETPRGQVRQQQARFPDDFPIRMNSKSRYRILWYESAGFLLLMVMAWFDEYHAVWQESALESGAVLAVWVVVLLFTWRLIARLHYLERFLRVCAWCKKIEHENNWIPLEQFLKDGLNAQTSHGICPACADRVRAESGRYHQHVEAGLQDRQRGQSGL